MSNVRWLMDAPFLVVRRHPYEEPYHTQLEFTVTNGTFSGAADIYCNVDDIASIGRALEAFPSRIGDQFVYEYGTDDPSAKFYRHFVMRAYTVDGVGHCALQFAINLNEAEPNEGVSRFSIKAEPSAIGRLGALFAQFAELRHLELHWSPTSGELHAKHQPPAT
jgi:hypothetical protein